MMQGSDSFRLVVRRGPQPNQTYELNKDINTLGRDITNDIVINDPEVSRHHMRLTREAGGFTVEDLGSTNGTFINGLRLSGARPLRNEVVLGAASAPDAGGAPTVAGQQQQYPESPAAGVAPLQPSAPQQQPQYQPPAQQGQYNAPQSPYAPPSANAQQGNYNPYAPQQSPQSPQSSAYGAAPSPSPAPLQSAQGAYGDQYVYEEEPRSTMRWVLIGCAGLSLFCCCSTVLGLIAVDTLCLWNRIPLAYDILRAFGYTMVC
jgi:hypothetical protein